MQRVPAYLIYTLAAILLAASPVRAAHGEDPAEALEELHVQNLIFSHIGDAYEWHITTIGKTHVTIPLPVILYSRTSGLHVFMSSKLHGGSHDGFYLSQSDKYNGKLVEKNAAGEEVRPIDLSITKIAAALMINGAIMLWIMLGVARWYKRRPERSVPKGFAGAVEMFVMDIVDNLIKPCIGPDYKKFTPYLLTSFFFILICNMMGLFPFFPGGASTTGNIAITLTLALFTLVIVNFSGNKEYWKEIFWPEVPVWMKVPVPLMPAIELFGIFTKPFALMIRLFANMMAGHAVILGLTTLIFITAAIGPAINASMTVLSVVMTIFMNLLEILVAYIQAYVFTMLSAVFISLARPVHHHKPNPQKLETK